MTLFCPCFTTISLWLRSYIVSWRSLADPSTIPPKNESSLTELLVEIRGTVGQEAQIVQAVFPNPSLVMQVFLQRVFAQSVIARKSSLSFYIKNMIDSATYGAAPHPSRQYVGSSVLARLAASSHADVCTR